MRSAATTTTCEWRWTWRCDRLERVEILRFHQMGSDKWEKLGLDYPLKGVEPPDAELTERVRGQFRSSGLTVY